MTTIAADRKAGVMASDSQWSDGTSCGPCRKVFRVRGELIGMAGELKDCQPWLQAYRRGKDLSQLTTSVNALRLGPAGLHAWDSADGWLPVGHQYAIGSGGVAARAAMATKATVAVAVRIACTIDANSGGRVRTYRL
jgi:ATP-dependent protease HslVU (ClpYQ) peptidase subunit